MLIYKTTNLLNNKIYIGKSKYNNPDYYGSGVVLNQAIKKYGKANFKKEIIEFVDDEAVLNDKEKYWISFYKSFERDVGYNRTMGGDGGKLIGESLAKMIESSIGRTHSEETKRMLSEINKGKHEKENNCMWGKIPWNKGLTAKTDNRIAQISKKASESNRGRPLSDEHKLNISIGNKGKNTSKKTEIHKERISNALKGRKLSKETSQKMSAARKGVPQSKITCPHCGKTGGTTMYRWHFDNCKLKDKLNGN